MVFDPVCSGKSCVAMFGLTRTSVVCSDTKLVYRDAPRGASNRERKAPVCVSGVIVYFIICGGWYIRFTEWVCVYYSRCV